MMKDEKHIPTVYYGVYTPNEKGRVFEDKLEALKAVKKNKKSRFKAFSFYHDAATFCLNGSECPNNNTVNGSLLNKASTESSQAVGEKASPFKGPRPQELVELRKAIETGNIQFVKDTIWQNPRYLVSSGDTPSILQEGSRYNALHVAAKSRNAEITELILNTICDTEFVKLLYGDDNQENAEDRTAVLLDLYLNMPNKGLNETPLHFASKHGAADVVEILVSYPQCDKTLKNKFYKTADQIICERADCENIPAIRRKIDLLLKDSYYVPVLRAEDNSMPPIIGEPFSPSSPPVLNGNPLSPRLEIHAYAGPMEKKNAHVFRRKWKTPPRSLTFASPTKNSPKRDVISVSALRFKDPQKGLERIGNKLANEFDVNWKEYWPFLGSFLDIASEEGLDSLESYLASRCATPDTSKTTPNPPQTKFDESLTLSPVANLCAAFSACRLSDRSSDRSSDRLSDDRKNEVDSINYIDKACQVFANRISNDVQLYSGEDVVQVLETEIKQLELLMTSYMDDPRFLDIDFQKIHSRLALMIARKLHLQPCLLPELDRTLDLLTASVDCFSSDDEMRDPRKPNLKPTVRRKQLVCLLRYLLNALTLYGAGQWAGLVDWAEAEACSCMFHVRRAKRNSLSRSGSFKGGMKVSGKMDVEGGVGRRLCFDDDVGDGGRVPNGYNLDYSMNRIEIDSDDSDIDEEKFYTPPTSPSFISEDESDSEDEFNDTEPPKQEMFIEGDFPTKIDCEVFNALCYADVNLDSKKHPNIYKWHHTVSLYSNEERESWPTLKDGYCAKPCHNSSLDGSFPVNSPRTSTPAKPWLRITGANSPKAVFKSRSMHL
ncbi:unnamed protein product [Phaedon cochleariae]|uniref:ANKLE2 third alpha/beta domain-containing protein n=1 Tax=Phaedon cochleariae TaxID=80249 RepID=A0A9N9SKJ3_PHACE|nr:unnamed protein product [Phaedon cochleariae]